MRLLSFLCILFRYLFILCYLIRNKSESLKLNDIEGAAVGQKDYQQSLFGVWHNIFSIPRPVKLVPVFLLNYQFYFLIRQGVLHYSYHSAVFSKPYCDFATATYDSCISVVL